MKASSGSAAWSADGRMDGRDLDQKLQDMPLIAQKSLNAQASSRADDRYHYVPSAHLSLKMLAPNTDLKRSLLRGQLKKYWRTVVKTSSIWRSIAPVRTDSVEYAALHFATCADLAERIKDIGLFEPHLANVRRLSAEHAKKTGFWSKSDGKK